MIQASGFVVLTQPSDWMDKWCVWSCISSLLPVNQNIFIFWLQAVQNMSAVKCKFMSIHGTSSLSYNWVMSCWHGFMSGARCKWFAYGPTDATASPSSLASLESRWV